MKNYVLGNAMSRMLYFVLLILVPITASVKDACAQVLNPANGHYYQVISATKTWDDAKVDAESRVYSGMKGHLATINSAAENSFVNTLRVSANVSYMWLGGYQPTGSPEPDGNWQWVTGEPFTYLNWLGSEPNNAGAQNGLAMWSINNGTWDDAQSYQTLPYMVEYDAVNARAVEFTFTGEAQTFTIPQGVTSITIDAWGAQGWSGSSPGGSGGFTNGTLAVTPGETLIVYVGGQGAVANIDHVPMGGGFNGGGNGQTNAFGGLGSVGGGGGASDVRQGGNTLLHRVLVAGGGGGSTNNGCSGGAGGGLVGGNGGNQNGAYPLGTGGSQSAGGSVGGSLGEGGDATPDMTPWNGGGGGGYYGGGVSTAHAAGGGGSSYDGGLTNSRMKQGVKTGNGLVVFTYIIEPNNSPQASNQETTTSEDLTKSLTLAATDADTGDTLSYKVTDLPDHGKLFVGTDTTGAEVTTVPSTLPNNGNKVTYKPNSNYNGDDSFKFKATDGKADSNEATVTITVDAVNDAPSFGLPNEPNQTVAEDCGAEECGTQSVTSFATVISAGPADENAQKLDFIVTNNNNDLFATQPSIDTDGKLTYKPAKNASGSATLKVKLHDNGGTDNAGVDTSAEQSFTITVTPVNDAPTVADDIDDVTVNEDAADTTINLTNVFADIDDNTLTYTVHDNTQPGIVTASIKDGVLTLDYQTDKNGTLTITIRAKDAGGLYVNDTFDVTVKPTPDYPAVDKGFKDVVVNEDAPTFDLSYLEAFLDVDGDELTFTIEGNTNPDLVTKVKVSDVLHLDFAANASGTATITVRATDPSGRFVETTFLVTVKAVNDAPTLDAITDKTINEGSELTFSAVGSDIEKDTLKYSLVSAPAGASINEDTGAFSWTPTEAQGPGEFNFQVKVIDNGTSDGEADPRSGTTNVKVTVNEVNQAPNLGKIEAQSGSWGNEIKFQAGADDNDLPKNTLTFSLVNAPTGTGIDTENGDFSWTPTSAQIGKHTFKIKVTDNGTPNLSAEGPVEITVSKRATKLEYSGAASGQYSDPATVKATLTDTDGNALPGLSVSFTIGTQSTSATTNSNGLACGSITLNQKPDNYQVVSSFAGNDQYSASGDSDAFCIRKEDARATYTGALYASTSSVTSSKAMVTLGATIRDIIAVTDDAAYDANAGDIRNATVTFINRDNNTVIGTAPLGLVNGADTKTGTATYNWSVDIGNADSKDFTVGIVVNNYYTRNSSDDNNIITVAKPLNDFISGSGFIKLTRSAGEKAGSPGSKANFGFSVKFNKKGTNLQGNMNVMVRSGDKTYQLKGNNMTSLVAQPGGKAIFNGKASIQDISDPLNPIAVDGNATLQLVMTDRGEPGTTDSIGITIWNKSGGLWFSSNWDGSKTVETTLGGGNIVVKGTT